MYVIINFFFFYFSVLSTENNRNKNVAMVRDNSGLAAYPLVDICR